METKLNRFSAKIPYYRLFFQISFLMEFTNKIDIPKELQSCNTRLLASPLTNIRNEMKEMKEIELSFYSTQAGNSTASVYES